MIIDRLLIPSFTIKDRNPTDFDLLSNVKWKGPLISWVSEYQYENFEFEISSPSIDLYFLAESSTVFSPQTSSNFFLGVYTPLLDEERVIKSFITVEQGQFYSDVSGTVAYQSDLADSSRATRTKVDVSIDSLTIDFDSLPTYDSALTVGTFQYNYTWTLDDDSVVNTQQITLNILLYKEIPPTPTPTPTPTFVPGTPWELTVCQGFTKNGEFNNNGNFIFGTNGYTGVVYAKFLNNDNYYAFVATNTTSIVNASIDSEFSDWTVFTDVNGYNLIAMNVNNTYRIQGTTYTRLDKTTDKARYDSQGYETGLLMFNFFHHTIPSGSLSPGGVLPEIGDLFGLNYGFEISGSSIVVNIDWGDGSEIEEVRTIGFKNHTYPSPGIYVIKLYCGESENIRFDFGMFAANTDDYLCYHKLIDVGVAPYIPGWYSCNSTFFSCTGLTAINPDLFKNNPQLIDFNQCFLDCSGLTTQLSSDLFKYNTVTSANSMFRGCCSYAGTIPSGLFAGQSNLTDANSLFNLCFNLSGSIPEDLFSGCLSLLNVHGAFQFCENLVGPIPEHLFKSSPAINTFTVTFFDCFNLTEIPANLFSFNTNVGNNSVLYSFFGTFYGCYSISSPIPEDLFKYNTKVSEFAFRSTFYICMSIIGSIPTDFFKYNILASTYAFTDTFQFCGNLTGSIPTDLFKYNTEASENAFWQTFAYCYGLSGSIPVDLFKYNTKVVTTASRYSSEIGAFRGLFYRCENLSGAIPVDLFKYNTLVQGNSFELTFFKCKGLTSIPSDLFRYNPLVSDYAFNSTFEFCSGLTGAIPTDLFKYNTLVGDRGFYQTFTECTSLSSIPKNLFLYNTITNSFYATLQGCNNLTLDSELFCTSEYKSTLFKDRNIDFTYCMNYGDFTGSIGTAPDLWNYDFGSGIIYKGYCFKGQTYLSVTNINDIPLEWGRNP